MPTTKTNQRHLKKYLRNFKIGMQFDLPKPNLGMKHFLLFFFSLMSLVTVAQTDCSIMKSGRFKDVNDLDKTAYIEISDKYLIDYAKNGTKYIKSSIHWLTDCAYELTLIETNIENLGITIGTKLRVEILEVSGNEITYQYLPEDSLEPRKLIKLSSKDIPVQKGK